MLIFVKQTAWLCRTHKTLTGQQYSTNNLNVCVVARRRNICPSSAYNTVFFWAISSNEALGNLSPNSRQSQTWAPRSCHLKIFENIVPRQSHAAGTSVMGCEKNLTHNSPAPTVLTTGTGHLLHPWGPPVYAVADPCLPFSACR